MSDATRKPGQLEEELRGLKNILSVAQVVVSSLELDEVLDNILGSAMAIMEMPAGSIALYDERTGRLELRVAHGLSDAFTARRRWRVTPGGLTATILDKGDLFVVEDTEKAVFFRNPLALAEGIRSLIAVPLKIQEKLIGILYVDDFVPRRFDATSLKMLSILGSFASMSIDNARLHARTLELACTDGLTGVYNHRHFKKLFADELGRARRYGKELGLIMFDIDDFKAFNDRYGHPVGDRVLAAVAEILRETLRDCDQLFRYGGEEFIALLPETDLQSALAAAERCRRCIERESADCLAGITDRGVTISVGVAVFPRDGETFDGLLKAVDDLMYVAKREGKNKVYHMP
ncbi:diguanylate cyclase with GAF sensor [Geothermobacter ehrlichii]|uniref:diguanylate cyclase n=1 Tax=Geothermobacter ehrlichii TaxID=213224 RepID=A0A5D3WMP0_9BACT|nr:sensor domain-containing diguanylate cyclase [Geothermobacter ehrlichii]TYO99616.1 diguanylate cyclase with GAF sensor [Geothermobacter ehrlichii]